VLAVGAVGEFAPVIAFSLLLTDKGPLRSGLMITAFVLVAALAAWLALRPHTPRLHRLMAGTLGTSAQFMIRLAMLVIVAMLWIASSFGERRALALFASTALPLIVVITGIGVQAGELDRSTAAMVAAGMLTVLLFPLLALCRLGQDGNSHS
jgi:hypothetical protein